MSSSQHSWTLGVCIIRLTSSRQDFMWRPNGKRLTGHRQSCLFRLSCTILAKPVHALNGRTGTCGPNSKLHSSTADSEPVRHLHYPIRMAAQAAVKEISLQRGRLPANWIGICRAMLVERTQDARMRRRQADAVSACSAHSCEFPDPLRYLHRISHQCWLR